MRQLEDENRQLKGVVADLTLDKHMLQEVLRRSSKPAALRQRVDWLVGAFRLSKQRACRLTRLGRSTYYWQSNAND